MSLTTRFVWIGAAIVLAGLAAVAARVVFAGRDFPDAPHVRDRSTHPIRVVTVVTKLSHPWSLAFMPGGAMLVTERDGRLRMIRDGTLDPQPIPGVPQVRARSQGGLMDVVLHPDFATNRFVYLTYSKPGARGATTALARGVFDGRSLTEVKDVFVADAWATTDMHFGSRVAFDRDGTLYLTVGERNERQRAQGLTDHAGKVLRLRDDGSVPPDNPITGRPGAKPEIYSYGHRNPQGLVIHPETGTLWSTEHGPRGGDELNRVEPGRNYGWPVITYGREYSGPIITDNPVRAGMEQPVHYWVPSIGTSGLAFYTGDMFPLWKGSAFVGGLVGNSLHRVALQGGQAHREVLLEDLRQRVRDVRQGPDGFLYVLTDEDDGALLRIEPAAQ